MTEIRPVKDESEVEQSAALMHASEPWITLEFDLEKCRLAMQGDYKETYIATVNGVYAGFVVIQPHALFRGYIQSICVGPQFRSQGIGTALLNYSEERISKVSPNVFMCVSSFNHRAQKLYYSLGYEKVGELKDHIVKGYDEYLLRKSKGPIRSFKPAG